MTGTSTVAIDPGTEDLMRFTSGYRPGDQVHAGTVSVELHLKIGLGGLVAMGHDLFLNDQTAVSVKFCPGDTAGGIHPLDLDSVHLHDGTFGQFSIGLGIDDPFASALANADMFFQIAHMCPFLEEKAVNAVVLGSFFPFGMDAASRHNGDISVFPYIEIVIDQIIHIAVGDAGGDIDIFIVSSGLDENINPRLAQFGFDLNVFGGLAAATAAVFPDIVSAVGLIKQIGNQPKEFFGNRIHTVCASSCLGQNWHLLSPESRVGRISSRGPWAVISPSARTTISSAMLRIRS